MMASEGLEGAGDGMPLPPLPLQQQQEEDALMEEPEERQVGAGSGPSPAEKGGPPAPGRHGSSREGVLVQPTLFSYTANDLVWARAGSKGSEPFWPVRLLLLQWKKQQPKRKIQIQKREGVGGGCAALRLA